MPSRKEAAGRFSSPAALQWHPQLSGTGALCSENSLTGLPGAASTGHSGTTAYVIERRPGMSLWLWFELGCLASALWPTMSHPDLFPYPPGTEVSQGQAEDRETH